MENLTNKQFLAENVTRMCTNMLTEILSNCGDEMSKLSREKLKLAISALTESRFGIRFPNGPRE